MFGFVNFIGISLFDRCVHKKIIVPIQKYAVIGKNFTISCETSTNVPFKWRKDATNITESNKRYCIAYLINESEFQTRI